MCGFFYSNNSSAFDNVINCNQLKEKILVRGPDSVKVLREHTEGYHILFSRLVLSGSPSLGIQPCLFYKGDRALILLFNGEIFNFIELAKKHCIQLEEGFGDTEVLTRLFQMIPIDEVLASLKGMYSICILEPSENRIFLSRDYFGKLPLYYAIGANNVVSVSSMPSLVAISTENSNLSQCSVISYFIGGYSELGASVFEGVNSVQPNEYLVITNGIVEVQRQLTRDFDMDATSLQSAVQKSIGKRINTKRKIAIFYSHGMDSSIIKLLLENKIGNELESFTAYFNGEKSIRKHIITLEDYKSETQNILRLIDDPIFDPATTILSLLCKSMNNETKVVFSGDGADEFDGGYQWYRRYKILRALRMFPVWPLVCRFLPGRLNDLLTCSDRDLTAILRSQVSSSLFERLRKYVTPTHPLLNIVDDLRNYDITTFLPQTMLRKNDIAGSINGKEIRSPFLDEDLFFQFYSKSLGKQQIKKIFLDLFGAYPQKKQGFDLPLGEWKFCTDTDLEDFMRLWRKYVSSDTRACEHIVEYHRKNEAGKYIDLKIFQMVNWMRAWEKIC